MAKRDVPIGSKGEAGNVATKVLVFLLVVALVLGLAKLFSVQNATPVAVWFYNWKFTAPLADVILLALCLGALIMALVFLSFCLRRRLRKKAAPSGQKQGGPAPGPTGSPPETGP